KDNRVKDKREVEFELKPLAYIKNLPREEIAQQIRSGFFGYEVQRLQLRSEEMKVWVRYPEDDRNSLNDLMNMRIKTDDGEGYPLSELINYKIVRGIQTIKHYNGERELTVEADLADQNDPVPPILERIEKQVITKMQEQFPDVRYSFEGQAKENRRVAAAGQVYGLLALLVIVTLVTLSLRSLPQALIVVLLTVPIGICFGIIGHGIEGKSISLFSIIGMIGLTGVIVNDAVIYVDRFNRNLKSGMHFRDAIVRAGVLRFRAILLTSLTTVAGLYPLILETSTQAQFLIPMAISIAYGVLFATVIILLFVPVYFHIMSDIRVGLIWLWTGSKPDYTRIEPAVREKKRLHEEGFGFEEEADEELEELSPRTSPTDDADQKPGDIV
ncbi:MAG: efflux RND transporter permease subunit, partial [Bacteroidota bacterium]